MRTSRISPFVFALIMASLAHGCAGDIRSTSDETVADSDGGVSDRNTGGAQGAGSDVPANDGSDAMAASSDHDAGSGDITHGNGTDTPDADTPDADTSAMGFVGQHGALHVDGNRVVDQQGEVLQLRGMSLFWSQWSDFYRAETVDALADDWNATLVRAVMGVENDGGYLQSAQPNIDKVRAIVDRAIARGIYVIIDWHDHHAQEHASQANEFFAQMADLYGNDPSVIFEVYNEPVDVDWQTVKSYAETVVQTIRGHGANNLIIVGTPNWSQDVDIAAGSPIQASANVAYTLHFYANTHTQPLRDKAKAALDRGIPLFVTEWGTCSADGNGTVNDAETRTWLGFLAEHGISWANWALNNKDEACSALVEASPANGPWADDQLTVSGKLVKSLIGQ